MKKTLIGIVVAAILLVPLYFTIFGPGIMYSDGTRSGIVRRISLKGFTVKTWEGELDLGRNIQNSNDMLSADIFHFSVENDTIAEEIRKAEKTGKRTTLYYKEYILRGYTKGMTNYNIYKVE